MEIICSLTNITDDMKRKWRVSDQQSGVKEVEKDFCISSVGEQAYSAILYDEISILYFPVGSVSHHSVLYFLSPIYSQVYKTQASKTQWQWNLQRV